jgi:L-fucose isomerase-like protein
MQEKPRVGLILMRSGEVCCEEPGEFSKAIRADEQIIVDRLTKYLEIRGPWVVDSPDTLRDCRAGLRDSDLDMVIMAFQTQAEDGAQEGLLDAIGDRPLVIWCYLPWRRLPRPASYSELQRTTGLVGAFAALGTLHNQGTDFLFTFGAPDDPRLIRDLQVTGRAALLRRKLRHTRIGLLPAPTNQASSTFVDEQRLKADLGPVVEHIPVEAFRKAAAEVSPGEVSAYLARLRERIPNSGVTEETLERAARAALGLAALAGQHTLDVLALDDTSPELLSAFSLRPALYPDLRGSGAVLYQPEADLGAAAANYILRQLTGSPTMFLELLFWDEALNQVVGGHGGLQNPANADAREIQICRDFGCCLVDGADGAQLQFLAREGRVTLLQLRSTPSGWQAVALSGVCVEGLPWLEGLPHAILRLDATVEHFLNRAADVGVTQHWVMAYGSVLHEIEAFCRMAKIPVEALSY